MRQLTVYAVAPLSTPLAQALLGLGRIGLQVQLRPLAELPTPRSRRQASLRVELLQLSLRLATIGEALTAHEDGVHRLAAGDEQGLRQERDDLLSRKRGVQAALTEVGKPPTP